MKNAPYTYSLVDIIDGSESSRRWDSLREVIRAMGPDHCARYERDGARYLVRRLSPKGRELDLGHIVVQHGRGQYIPRQVG